MVSQSREHQIILNFGPDTRRDGVMQVHALHPDCKTVHWQTVESGGRLEKRFAMGRDEGLEPGFPK
jgi:hypothetical protein